MPNSDDVENALKRSKKQPNRLPSNTKHDIDWPSLSAYIKENAKTGASFKVENNAATSDFHADDIFEIPGRLTKRSL